MRALRGRGTGCPRIREAREQRDRSPQAGVGRVMDRKGVQTVSRKCILIEGRLFDVRKNGDRPTGLWHAIGMGNRAMTGRKIVAGIMILMEGERELFEVVLTL